MRFFLDENIPFVCREYLLSLNYEVFDVRGTANEGISDNHIFQLAQELQSVFVTTDRDFFHTVPHLYNSHYGVIVINLRRPNREEILKKLKWVASNINLSELDSKVILLKDNGYSVYSKS